MSETVKPIYLVVIPDLLDRLVSDLSELKRLREREEITVRALESVVMPEGTAKYLMPPEIARQQFLEQAKEIYADLGRMLEEIWTANRS